jgi:hypothetical protein
MTGNPSGAMGLRAEDGHGAQAGGPAPHDADRPRRLPGKAPAYPEPSIIAPFAPPRFRLVRRTVTGPDAEPARAASRIIRDEMRADGLRLIARSERYTSRGVVIHLVFAARG